MQIHLSAVSDLFKARLSRRIVLWVFASIVVIEGIILIPSVYRRERELLIYLQELSAARASGIFEGNPEAKESELLKALMLTLRSPGVTGGALYHANGTLVQTFGEVPQLTGAQVLAGKTDLLNRPAHRYDAIWQMSPLEGRYILVIRHDASQVRQELIAFIFRIGGLVLIISTFVTGVTMIGLERFLISSILGLRRDLLAAGQAISDGLDARSLPFESVGVARRDELGDVMMAFQQMVEQISDAIAQRKHAEIELRVSEEKFAKAFRSSPNPIILSTLASGQLIDVNDSFLALFGGTADSVLGRTAVDLGLWEAASDREQMVQALSQAGVIRNQEYRFRAQTGNTHTILYSAERVLLNGQECILSVINDITQRKQMEDALKESELRFRTLVEQAADALYMVDLVGQIVDVNQRSCDALQYSREELLRLNVVDIQQNLQSSHDFAQLVQRVQRETVVTVIGQHCRKDGSTFPVEVRIGLIEFGGQTYFLGFARDITERKQAEQALARLAEIGELAAMIVHEVRSPLTTVLMGLNTFKQLDLDERFQMRLQLALEESDRLQRLLNEILQYAREQTLDLMPLDLGHFCQQLLPSLQAMPLAVDRTIHLQTEAAAIDLTVYADPDKLKQVVINLISNACEAIPPGATVHWRLVVVPPRSIQMQIHNGGNPIPPDVLPNLARPFFTTKSSGNGLGLAITKRIVEAHQGELGIVSSATAGTTVTVTLPQIHIQSTAEGAEDTVP